MNDCQTTHPALPGLLADFLTQLGNADALRTHDSPLLTDWTTGEVTGALDNEVVRLSWEDAEHRYAIALTEGAIASGRWERNTFHCLDAEGGELAVFLYRLAPIAGSFTP